MKLTTLIHEKSFIANLKGDTELAIDYYTQGLEAAEIMAFSEIQTQVNAGLLRKMFPAFCDHPRFQQKLADFALDQKSISKLDVPALLF